MKIQALWFGGSGYAMPIIPKDIENFRSIRVAREVFENRLHDHYYPCVENPEMHIYKKEYSENGPDIILRLGSKGGVIKENFH